MSRDKRGLRAIHQVGAPRGSHLRDFYVHMLHWSWFRLLFGLGVAYTLANLPFALLYLARPGCVSGVDDLFSAFAFSVETMSTIGYGAMAPMTQYAHTIVTIEAAFGMLVVALVTGLLFAKFSRPKANVIFSDVAITHTWHGDRVLSFRIANARGHEVVDAQVRLAVLIDEVSPEGVKMRRLHELPVVRDRTPVFLLSWTVFHRLDENSPLSGYDRARAEAEDIRIVATFQGIDASYVQTVYATHMYEASDLREDHHFVDVITVREDKSVEIDYRRFHDTVPAESDA